MGLPKPDHPLISLINFEDISPIIADEKISIVMGCYSIALKKNFNGILKYGQQEYDFDGGILTFMAPGQVMGINVEKGVELQHSGWLLLIHPDFLWNTTLAKNIKQYEYFGYAVNEALFLSEREESLLVSILRNIKQEYHSNIDSYSQGIIIAHIELFLSYAERFYNRQFITRKAINHQILSRLEEILTDYFNSDDVVNEGLPTVQYIADTLNLSPNYLSSVLKALTGQSTQQHIHEKLIEKAKEKLSTTSLTISEIAFELGFEHSQSFSKLFKTKTNLSPLEFRQSFH